LILSDINMPGMSGLELLPKAKAMRPDVPIIMITAYGDAETKRKALEGGAEARFVAYWTNNGQRWISAGHLHDPYRHGGGRQTEAARALAYVFDRHGYGYGGIEVVKSSAQRRHRRAYRYVLRHAHHLGADVSRRQGEDIGRG
jgi:CheY-like chemotaxis protein